MKIFTALLLFMAVCLVSIGTIPLYAQDAKEDGGTEDGRKMSREAQVALVEANRRLETNPDDIAAARQPLLDFLALPQEEPIPIMVYQMLGQFWYSDEANKTHIMEAQKVFKAGHEAFPTDENLLLNFAVTTYELERFGDAAVLFEKYHDVSADHDIKYLNYAAAAFYTAENLNEAKRVFLRMIGLVETPESAWLESVIYICQAQEDSIGAEKYIRLALDYYPMEKKYWNLMANVYLEKEDYKGGAAALEIATRVKLPEKGSEWQTLIGLYNFIRLPLRSAESIQAGMSLLAKDNSTEEAQQLLVADAYAISSRVDKAVAYLDELMATAPNFNLLLKKATILYDARRNKEAIAVLDQCIAMNKKAYEAYYMKGWAAWDLKDWETAKDAFDGATDSKDYGISAQDALEMLAGLDEAKSK